jgi:tRNA-2-methylthio-N6-dimethylallyladenosine synthase
MEALEQISPDLDEQPRLLYVQTFGCQMNEYDSLRVQRILAHKGYRPTMDLALADVIFLNTCSVREKAEQKVYSFLGRLRRYKLLNPRLIIVVAGCVAQQLGKTLLQRFDYLDLVVGTRGISAIADLLEVVSEKACRLAHLPEQPDEGNSADILGQSTPLDSQIAAPVTIMQGCNNFCTYCIVPHVRGRERSRPPAEVLAEVQKLVAGGAKEVLLLGQNVNSYGRGLGEEISFVTLLESLSSQTEATRIRFTTSHPKDLTDDLIACFANLPKLCRHLHLPVQAGSDRILQRMNRNYTADGYLQRIELLRRTCPEIAISSDVMVGFPGETEEDFQATLRMLEQVQFDSLFSFIYSDRPFTKSSEFTDKVTESVKIRRLMELQSLQAEISSTKNQAEVGQLREVLVEGPSKNAGLQVSGRTLQNRIVNFEGPDELTGHTVIVKIVDALSHSLRGELPTVLE